MKDALRKTNRLGRVACLALGLSTFAGTALADEKRTPQDYGAPKDHGADEVAIWVPRVVLFPLWLTSEYLIRQPVGGLVKVAEREQWPQEIVDVFTFGDRRQITIFPSALFDFGLLPSVGFNATWRYLGADPNTLRWHFGTWGPDWIATRLVDTYALSETESLAVDASFVRRQDNPFYGIGPDSSSDSKTRYRSTEGAVSAAYLLRPWRASMLEAQTGFRAVKTEDASCCDDPSLEEGVRRGFFSEPTAFGQAYQGVFQRLAFALDSRMPRPSAGTGARIGVHGEGTFAPDSEHRRAWVKYGADAGGFLDVTGTQRVLSAGVAVELADPLTGDLPFTENTTLGGDQPMRGFLRGRLVDRSSFVTRLQYTWPVWVFLDGVLQVDAGNVFGAGFDGFDPKKFRLSSGVGLRSNGERDSAFEVLVAAGTDPLDDGFHVSSFRLVVGSHHGF